MSSDFIGDFEHGLAVPANDDLAALLLPGAFFRDCKKATANNTFKNVCQRRHLTTTATIASTWSVMFQSWCANMHQNGRAACISYIWTMTMIVSCKFRWRLRQSRAGRRNQAIMNLSQEGPHQKPWIRLERNIFLGGHFERTWQLSGLYDACIYQKKSAKTCENCIRSKTFHIFPRDPIMF